MQKQAFRKNLNKNKMMRAAAEVASRSQNQKVATNIIHDAADGKILKKEAHSLVKEVLGLTDQEFLDQVRDELGVMVSESLDTLPRKLDAIPGNKYLRLVEFKDGSHGKFRTKVGKFGVGSVAKLVEGVNGMWDVVGDYDRRSRLREG